jgi:N-acetylglucosamine-6-phosphate deacetylase
MPRILLQNAQLLDPEAPEPVPGALLLEGDRIAGRLDTGQPVDDARVVDLGGRRLAPGFLDVHHHGRAIFDAPDDAAEGVRQDARYLLRHGVTGFLPTTVAWPARELRERVMAISQETRREVAGGAQPLGLHLEGPWILPAAAGAQPPKGIRPYQASEGRELLDAAEGAVRMVTLAPEVPGAVELQGELARRGIVAALGHSKADESETLDAISAGAAHVTHRFNAMPALHHRRPGLTGIALADDRLSCDLICDGVHVHPALVRVAARAKGERLALITDRLAPPAEARGFGAGGIRDDGQVWRLPDGTLAGSRLHLDQAVRNAIAFKAMTPLAAIASVTLAPARLLGLESQHGTLRPGARADLVVLDADWQVAEIWLGGQRLHP